MLKIALIDPSLFTWPYDSELANGFIERGHEVVIFGRYLLPGERSGYSSLLHEIFYPALRYGWMQKLPRPVFLALKGPAHILSLMRLLRHLRAFKPDIIHFQWVPLPIVDQLYIPLFRRIAPAILTVHDSNPFNNNPGSGLQRLSAFSIMRHFDRLIVHTEQARKRLIARGLEPKCIARIPHGALGQSFGDAVMPPIAGKEKGVVTCLLFGKLKPYKGADILLEALALTSPEIRARCHIRIAGKSYMDVEPLKELAKRLQIEKNITWDLRFFDDAEMAQMFAAADIVVMPYREIDASGILMMALDARRPIIASRIGLFAEMLEDGKHGYLVPPEDPKALAEALTKIVQDDAGRQTIGQNVAALREALPNWVKIAEMTEELYGQARAEWESSLPQDASSQRTLPQRGS